MRVIISGGGSGGHIFPAIAIADGIKKRWPNVELLFVGSKGKMEMEKVPRAGYKIEGLWISGIQRKSSLKNLLVPLKIISSLWKCRAIIRRFNPDICIGVGGYASGPLLQVAAWKNIPTLIQEQNSFPGLTNRILSKKVDRICVAFKGLDKYFDKDKIRMTGNPVRKDIIRTDQKRGEALSYFDLHPAKKTVLLFGGSLGAGTLNEGMKNNAGPISQKKDWQFIWQTGSYYEPMYKDSKSAGLDNVRSMKFIDRMDLAYSVADVIICRAGALTLAELALVGKPAILVPSPNVAEDHQTKNAMAFVSSEAARMLKDDEVVEKMMEELEDVLGDEDLSDRLGRNMKKMAEENAVDNIVKVIGELVDE